MKNTNYKALLVGVTDYSTIGADNLYGKNDVLVLGRALNEGLHIPLSNITVLGLSSEVVTKNDFIKSLLIEISKAQEDDIFIFYFSGHGSRISGTHYLFFSDGGISTQEVLNYIDCSSIKSKIFLIDACNTGTGELSDNILVESDFTSESVGKGTIVLGSCRDKEVSAFLSNQPISIFTSILANAFSSRILVRKGYVFMEDIANYVMLASKAGNGKSFNNKQTPVYYTNVIGDVSFQVADYKPYATAQYYSEHNDYVIYSVDDLCTNSAKRYEVKIIVKRILDKEELSDICLKVLEEMRFSDIFKSAKNEKIWKGKHVNHLFMYFGRDEMDMEGNYEYRATWVDDNQDKTHWYQGAKIIKGFAIKDNPSYEMLRRFTTENTGTRDEVFKATRCLLNSLINIGNKVISLYRSYTNDEMGESDFVIKATPIFKEIDELYFKISDLDIAPTELSRWSLLCTEIAGKVSDMTLFFNDKGMKTRTQSNRRDCMEMTIKHFQQDLLALKDEEKQLGIIA